MAPEIWRREKYGEKADIWSIGCILYELALLKKPFDGKNFKHVEYNVVTQPLSPIPDYVDTDIKMMIMTMLDKNPANRPSIWDLANLPCIQSRINQLVAELNCQEQVACVFEFKSNKDEEKRNEQK